MAEGEEGGATWKELGLDSRILQAVKTLRFKAPTMIQEHTIPLALAGKDILARASTGSGKTAAYSLPICHKLLRTKAAAAKKGGAGGAGRVSALILVPSKELCNQVLVHFREVLASAEGMVSVVDVSGIDVADWSGGQGVDVVVGTPTTVLTHVKAQHLDLSQLACCVVDEADALLSHPTVRKLRTLYPTTAQSFLMSATLSPAVLELKKLLLNNPVTVKLEEESDAEDSAGAADENEEEAEARRAAREASSTTVHAMLPNITQHYLTYMDDSERYCLLFALIRFKAVSGKVLIFVDSVDTAYRLKIFLEKFSLQAAVLNADIPLNSRNHIVAQFNMGHYSYLIATDRKPDAPAAGTPGGPSLMSARAKKAADAAAASEYGVSRGIDFREVAFVINFDSFSAFTEQACKSYVHRIGRTGRAGRKGTAITFVSKKEERKQSWVRYLNLYLEGKGQCVTEHPVAEGEQRREAMKLLYRTDDALLSIKRKAVKEAKVKELIQEALASQQLKQHFSENPNDLAALRHVAPVKKRDALAAETNTFIPDYMGTSCTGEMVKEDVLKRRGKKRQRGKKGDADADDDSGDDENDSDPDTAVNTRAKRRRKADPLQALKVVGLGGGDAADADASAAPKKKRIIKRKVVVRKKKTA